MSNELSFQPTKEAHLSYYYRNREKVKEYMRNRRHCCEVCNLEMAATYKSTHEKTARHRAAVAAQNGDEAPIVTSNRGIVRLPEDFTVCQTCNIRVLKSNISHHVKCKTHLKREAEKTEKAQAQQAEKEQTVVCC